MVLTATLIPLLLTIVKPPNRTQLLISVDQCAIRFAIRRPMICATHAALHKPSCSTILGSSKIARELSSGLSKTLRGPSGVKSKSQLSTFVDVTITCPTAPRFLEGTQFRCDKAAKAELKEKCRNYTTVDRAQPDESCPKYIQLVKETFGFYLSSLRLLAGSPNFNMLQSSETICSRRFLVSSGR